MAPRKSSAKKSKKITPKKTISKRDVLEKEIIEEEKMDLKEFNDEVNRQVFNRLPSSIPSIIIQTPLGETVIPANLPDGTIITIPDTRLPNMIPTQEVPVVTPVVEPVVAPIVTPVVQEVPIVEPIVAPIMPPVLTPVVQEAPLVRMIDTVSPTRVLKDLDQKDMDIFKGVAISSSAQNVPSVGAIYNPSNVGSCDTSSDRLSADTGRTACGFSDMFVWNRSVDLSWSDDLAKKAHDTNSFLWHTADIHRGSGKPSTNDFLSGIALSMTHSIYVDQIVISKTGVWRIVTPGINVDVQEIIRRVNTIGQASYNSNDPEEFVNFVNGNLYPIVYLSFFSFAIEDIEDNPVHIVEEMPLTAIEMITPVGPVVNSPVQFGRIPDMMGSVPRLVRGTQIPSPPSPPLLVLGPPLPQQGIPPPPPRAPTMLDQINSGIKLKKRTNDVETTPAPMTMLDQINKGFQLKKRSVEAPTTTAAPTILDQINNRPKLRSVANRVIEKKSTVPSPSGLNANQSNVGDILRQAMNLRRAHIDDDSEDEESEDEFAV